MNTPKPGPFVPKNNADPKKSESKKDQKKPFVRPAHLTTKPFQQNEGLRKLQSDLNRRSNKTINPKAKRQR